MLFKLKMDKKLCDIPQKLCINKCIIMIMIITFYPLIYFCHKFDRTFILAGCSEDLSFCVF